MILALPAHAPLLAAVHGAAFADDPWDAGSFETLLGQPGVTGLLDERGGVLLLRQVAGEAEILTIGVVNRRRGIGRALMQAAIAAARANGVTEMFLEVAAENNAARGLYQTLGFRAAGMRQRYYPDGGDALVLKLEVKQGFVFNNEVSSPLP